MKMNFTKCFSSSLLLIITICFIKPIHAQTPSWIWADAFGGISEQRVVSSALDQQGNVFVAGYYQTATFNIGSFTLNNPFGNSDGFVAKLDSSGTVLWAVSINGDDEDQATAITVDENGDAYVAGNFASGTISVNGTAVLNNNVPVYDNFIARLNGADGSTIWAQEFGTINLDLALAIASDGIGGIYLGGSFTGDSIVFGSTTVYNAVWGDHDSYLAKFMETGTPLWVTSGHGAMGNFVNGISFTADHKVMIAGYFEGPFMNWGTDTLWNNSNASQTYVAKYDGNGNFMWAKQQGGFQQEYVTGIATDYAGNSYVSGYTRGQFVLLNDTIYNGWLVDEPFLYKIDPAGNPLWLRGSEIQTTGSANSVCIHGSGSHVYICGYFLGSIQFDSLVLNCNGFGSNTYLVDYDSDGNVFWSKNNGGTQNYDKAMTVCVNAFNDVYMSGYFQSDSIQFGSQLFTNVTGGGSMFIAKLHNDASNSVPYTQTQVVSFELCPNPATDYCNVKLFSEDDYTISLCSITGQCFNHIKADRTTNSIKMDVTDLPSGIYLVYLIKQGKIISSKKLVKE